MIKTKITPLIVLVLVVTGCSHQYLQKSFTDFSEATGLIGKNTVYVYEQLQEEEINLRIAQAMSKEKITPGDLEPSILTLSQLELREEMIQYISNYTVLLESIVSTDHRKEILKNADIVQDNLTNISSQHNSLMTKQDIGFFSTLAAAIPEAITAGRTRQFLLETMRRHDPILEKVTGIFIEEISVAREMIDNILERQFRITIAEPWPDKASQREKAAKTGAKTLEKKRDIDLIMDNLLAAIATITPTHRRLIKAVEMGKGSLDALVSLIDYAARLDALYRDFLGQKVAKR